MGLAACFDSGLDRVGFLELIANPRFWINSDILQRFIPRSRLEWVPLYFASAFEKKPDEETGNVRKPKVPNAFPFDWKTMLRMDILAGIQVALMVGLENASYFAVFSAR